jgi:hypothetical protein
VGVALLLFDGVLGDGEPSATYTVSLDGGIPLSNLSFYPIEKLIYLNGSAVDFQGPVIKSVPFPVTSLGTVPQVERFDQFAERPTQPQFALLDRSQGQRLCSGRMGNYGRRLGSGRRKQLLGPDLTDDESVPV